MIQNSYKSFIDKNLSIICDEFNSDFDYGLSDNQVTENQLKYGKNHFLKNEISWFDILLRQLKSPFVYLLVFASIFSFLLNQFTDAIMVLFFIVINTILGFYQEYKSEQSAKLLNKLIAAKETVLRNGQKTEIQAQDLVAGDVVLLYPGDIVQADLRLIENKGLLIDESVLTGESEPQTKIIDSINIKKIEIFNAKNILFAGTNVISGRD